MPVVGVCAHGITCSQQLAVRACMCTHTRRELRMSGGAWTGVWRIITYSSVLGIRAPILYT